MRPTDFLIGIRDFFAILVPGAVFLLLIRPGAAYPDPISIFGLTVAAYLCGSLASGVGSLLDYLIDPLLRNGRFRNRFMPGLARRERLAVRLRNRMLLQKLPGALPFAEGARSFWWDHLRLNCSPGIEELNRMEAQQKLFRSLVVVFLAAALAGQFDLMPSITGIAALDAYPRAFSVGAASIAFAAYASGRYQFLNAVYRLGQAYALK